MTARSSDTLTIVRAQESSSARTILVGDQIAATITAKTATDLEAMFSQDVALSANAPIASETIPAGMSGYVVSDFEIADDLAASVTEANQQAVSEGTVWYAQSFTPTSEGLLDRVVLPLGVQGSPLDQFVVELRDDSSGLPGAVLDSVTISPATIAAVYWTEMTFTSKFLSSAVTYWIAVHRTGATDFTNYYTWTKTVSDLYAAGAPALSTNSGSTWSSDSGFDYGFRIRHSSVLELAAGAVLEIG